MAETRHEGYISNDGQIYNKQSVYIYGNPKPKKVKVSSTEKIKNKATTGSTNDSPEVKPAKPQIKLNPKEQGLVNDFNKNFDDFIQAQNIRNIELEQNTAELIRNGVNPVNYNGGVKAGGVPRRISRSRLIGVNTDRGIAIFPNKQFNYTEYNIITISGLFDVEGLPPKTSITGSHIGKGSNNNFEVIRPVMVDSSGKITSKGLIKVQQKDGEPLKSDCLLT